MRYLFTVTLLFQFAFLFGQLPIADNERDSTNIYYDALYAYMQKADIENTLYLAENLISTSGLPEKIGEVEIVILNGLQIRKKSRKSKLIIHRIIPLRFEGGVFFVNVIPFEVRSRRRKINLVNLGGMSIKFKYSCDDNTLSVLN